MENERNPQANPAGDETTGKSAGFSTPGSSFSTQSRPEPLFTTPPPAPSADDDLPPSPPPSVEEPIDIGSVPPVPPPPPPQRPERRRGFFGPLLLIAAGLVFLLNNMGLLPWSAWELIWRLWPVWLVALGLDMLLGRRSRTGAIIGVALTITLLAGVLFAFGTGRTAGWEQAGERVVLQQPLDAAKEARVSITSTVGQLEVSKGATAQRLAEGEVAPVQGEQVQQNLRMNGTVAHFTLDSTARNVTWLPWSKQGGGHWVVRLTDAIPLVLDLQTGVGRADIDLTGLQLRELSLTTGVGQTTIRLPQQGQMRVRIEAGVGQTTIELPQGVAARIRASAGLGQVSVSGDMTRDGDTYVSPDFETNPNRVDMTVDGGIGAINVRTIR